MIVVVVGGEVSGRKKKPTLRKFCWNKDDLTKTNARKQALVQSHNRPCVPNMRCKSHHMYRMWIESHAGENNLGKNAHIAVCAQTHSSTANQGVGLTVHVQEPCASSLGEMTHCRHFSV